MMKTRRFDTHFGVDFDTNKCIVVTSPGQFLSETLVFPADGEADGAPEAGRTWVESLAHWFAHGIKRILVRISGGEGGQGGEGGEGEQPADGEAADKPVADSPEPKDDESPTVVPTSTRRPKPRLPATSPRPWTVLPPVQVPNRLPVPAPTDTTTAATTTSTPTPAPAPSAEQSTPSAIIYDDETFDDGRVSGATPDDTLDASRRPPLSPLPDVTNELS